MRIRQLAAAVGLSALAALGAASLGHDGTTPNAQAIVHRPGQPSYIPPTVPAMHLGATLGEPTTTSHAHR